MLLANPPNLIERPVPEEQRRFGIRVGPAPGDSLSAVLGEDWRTEYWYVTREERDDALQERAKRHPYNRIGDWPTIRLEVIER